MPRTGTKYEGEYEHHFQEVHLITSEDGGKIVRGAPLPEVYATYSYVVDDFGDVCNFDLIEVAVPVYAPDDTEGRYTIFKNESGPLSLIVRAISGKKFETEAMDGLLETEFEDVVFRSETEERRADYRAWAL